MPDTAHAQLKAAGILRDRLENMIEKGIFSPPALRVYNPLTYAWKPFEEYTLRYGASKKRALFLGMNPGPWGMVQTGVPFGEVAAVRDWLSIAARAGRPRDEHPKYPVEGFACRRSEVSGRRLWGLFRERWGSAESFFEEHFVANYCPLLFIEGSKLRDGKEGARNLTPDKLPPPARAALYEACDEYIRALAGALAPHYWIGVGNFAALRAELAVLKTGDAPNKGDSQGAASPERGSGRSPVMGKILHPSPASPKSNSDWPGEAARQLVALGVWSGRR